ncbi:MAG: hypothetical protein ACI4PM_02080 [Butyricicoccus sp.]
MRKKWLILIPVGIILVIAAIGLIVMAYPTVEVDFSQGIGSIKEINGINNGPKSGYSVDKDGDVQWKLDATEIYEELGIPYVRTHDTEFPYGGEAFVDIHCIFPDWTKSANDPSAYHFEETDAYIQNILDSGAQVLFRLGESISISDDQIRYTYPPESYEKWTYVCWHIIRHYNDGWADGFHYNIQYWEIWNEPDVYRQWSADISEYYKLYQTAARYLKGRDSELMIGGGVLATADEESITAFLEGITDDGEDTPLDFFSWHAYSSDPSSFSDKAEIVRDTLDQNGYEDTLSFLDEWNYVDDWENIDSTWETIRSVQAAAFYAASLINMQNADIDKAMYYDGTFVKGTAGEWCGLYDEDGNKRPGYYAFQMFHQLQSLGLQVEAEYKQDDLYCCAATGESNGILLVNYSAEQRNFLLKLHSGKRHATLTRINQDNPDGKTQKTSWPLGVAKVRMEPGEVLYISLQ